MSAHPTCPNCQAIIYDLDTHDCRLRQDEDYGPLAHQESLAATLTSRKG